MLLVVDWQLARDVRAAGNVVSRDMCFRMATVEDQHMI